MLSLMSPGGAWFFPGFPPAPSPPRGVKGSWKTQFGFFEPDTGIGAGGCGAGLFSPIGERRSRSQGLNAWRGCESEANEHTRAPQAVGRAEQRSGGRIRAGACLSVASLRPTPGGASSAR